MNKDRLSQLPRQHQEPLEQRERSFGGVYLQRNSAPPISPDVLAGMKRHEEIIIIVNKQRKSSTALLEILEIR